jgi:hypothetical protein
MVAGGDLLEFVNRLRRGPSGACMCGHLADGMQLASHGIIPRHGAGDDQSVDFVFEFIDIGKGWGG